MSEPDPLGTTVEIAPSGWRGRSDWTDELTVGRDGVRVRLGRRTGAVPAATLARVEVWRGTDGVRRNRLLDTDGRQLALLHDQAWRLPDGRLAPLLERLGCAVESIDAPDDPAGTADQAVTGGEVWGLSGRWVAAAAVALLLVATFAGVSGAQSDLPGLEAGSRIATVALLLILVVVTLAWWAPWRRLPPSPGGIRPAAGTRRAWRERAAIGRVDDRFFAWDGWGRVARWPAAGPLAPGSVAAGSDAAVVLDQHDRPVVRLPLTHWAEGQESPETLAARVADVSGLRRAERSAPAGGEVLEDPPPPSLLLPVVACALLAIPLTVALAVGLFGGRALEPRPSLWIPAGVALLVDAAVLLGYIARHALRTRGSDERALPVTATGAVLTYPLWAGLGVVGLPLLLVSALPAAAIQAWLVLVLLVGVGGLAILAAAPHGTAYRLAVAVVPFASGPVALAGREVLPAWLVWTAGVLAVLAVLGAVLAGRLPHGRSGRAQPDRPRG